MIIRGTTPYHIFDIPFEFSDIQQIFITYLQNGQVVLDKNINDISVNEEAPLIDESLIQKLKIVFNNKNNEGVTTTIMLHLSQEDTLKFNFFPAAEKNIAVIQLRILDANNEAYASSPIYERIYGILKEGVISINE